MPTPPSTVNAPEYVLVAAVVSTNLTLPVLNVPYVPELNCAGFEWSPDWNHSK